MLNKNPNGFPYPSSFLVGTPAETIMARWPKYIYNDSSCWLQRLTLTEPQLALTSGRVMVNITTRLGPQTSPHTLRLSCLPYFSGDTCHTLQSIKGIVGMFKFASSYQIWMQAYQKCNEYPLKKYHGGVNCCNFLCRCPLISTKLWTASNNWWIKHTYDRLKRCFTVGELRCAHSRYNGWHNTHCISVSDKPQTNDNNCIHECNEYFIGVDLRTTLSYGFLLCGLPSCTQCHISYVDALEHLQTKGP